MGFEDTKLLSADCMVKRHFGGVMGNDKHITKRLSNVKITHSEFGKVALNREEAHGLLRFLEEAFGKEF